MAAAVNLVNSLLELSELDNAAGNSALALGVDSGLVTAGDTVEAQGKRGSGATSSLGVVSDGIPVDVGHVITLLVVTGIIGSTGTGEETGGGDSEAEEGNVIRRGTKGAGEVNVSGLVFNETEARWHVRVVGIPLLGDEVVEQELGADLVAIVVGIDGVEWVD